MPEKFKNLQNLTTPILVILLVISAFLIGSFYTKVQMLEKGTVSRSTQPAQTTRPASTILSSEKFAEVVKGAILVSGSENAKVKLVEFTDFECPFCARFFSETLRQIEKEYKAGQVAYYLRHFPLYSIHPNAENASLAAECAREQGKFREMHDAIFENQQKMSVAELKDHAVKIRLKTSQFDSCLDSKKYKDNIDRDVKLGTELGISGTPAFYLNGRVINGAQPFSIFKAAIDEELGK